MPNDHLLFFHGVRVTSDTFAKPLADCIRNNLGTDYVFHALNYYQTVHDIEDKLLMQGLNTSSTWKNFWYTPIRTDVIIPFLGDAVLYFNSGVGAGIIKLLRDQIEKIDTDAVASKEVVYLHLIGHSLGSVIIFDILFGLRWNNKPIGPLSEAYNDVQYIRDRLKPVRKDLGDHQQEPGIKLANIITMGSPIAIFGLMEAAPPPGVTDPRINTFMKKHQDSGVTFPWHNFYHPGDPIAYPVGPIIANLIHEKWKTLIVSNISDATIDLPVPAANWWEEVVNWVFSKLPYIQIFYGAYYHGSGYFEYNEKLAELIAGYVRAVHN